LKQIHDDSDPQEAQANCPSAARRVRLTDVQGDVDFVKSFINNIKSSYIGIEKWLMLTDSMDIDRVCAPERQVPVWHFEPPFWASAVSSRKNIGNAD
jgi:hypothetical protein